VIYASPRKVRTNAANARYRRPAAGKNAPLALRRVPVFRFTADDPGVQPEKGVNQSCAVMRRIFGERCRWRLGCA
jgi:hypothetical protein